MNSLIFSGLGGLMILIPMKSSCRHCHHQDMSLVILPDSLCWVLLEQSVLNLSQNLYKDNICKHLSGTTRQMWFSVLIILSVSLTLWGDLSVQVKMCLRYFIFFFSGSFTILVGKSHQSPIYMNRIEKSMNFTSANSQPNSLVMLQMSFDEYSYS